ncbi:MAG: hypothetical protein ACRC46_01400 [Thermoguttaceae bacterium]
MRLLPQLLSGFAFSTLLVVVIGCGEKLPPDLPKLYPVTVTVTYDNGTPVGGAMVVFYPVKGSSVGDWLCSAGTDDAGVAPMLTQAKYHGLPAGHFDVTVQKYITKGADVVPELKKNPTREEADAWSQLKRNAKQGDRYSVVELVYSSPGTTPLKQIEVKPGRNNLVLKVGPSVEILDKTRPPSR